MYLDDTKILPLKQRLRQADLPPDLCAVVRIQRKKNISFDMVEGRCQSVGRNITEGMGCQIYSKTGGSSFASTDRIGPRALDQCLEKALLLLPKGPEPRSVSAEALFASSPDVCQRFLPVRHGLETLSVADATGLLLDFHKRLKKLNDNVSAATGFGITLDEWRILRTDGSDVHFTMPRSILRHRITRAFQGESHTLSTSWIGNDYSPLLEDETKNTVEQRVQAKLELLERLSGAPNVAHGSYPILIDAHLTGGLVHEAFGHAAESDAVMKGSVLGEKGRFKTGMKVGPETISIVDGPVEYDWGYQPYSANGFPRQTVAVVRNGVLAQALADVFTASPTGTVPTGAERAESYSSAPIPRMSNIRLEIAGAVPWDVDFQDVSGPELYQFLLDRKLANFSEQYLFLSGYKGGQVNSTTGDFVFNCELIHSFRRGKTTLCRPAIFSGNIFAVLHSIRAGIGRQHIRRSGMCGKLGQRVPTSGGGPLFTLIGAHPDIRIGGR